MNLSTRIGPASRLVVSLVLLAAMAAGTGCSLDIKDDSRAASGGADTPRVAAPPATAIAAADTITPLPPPRPPLSRARDADHEFLRRMLDHHEAVLAIVHEHMTRPAGHAAHGTIADPVEWDAVLDAEKLEMLALLKSLYGEEFSPRATTRAPMGAAGHAEPPGGEHEGAEPSPLVKTLREGDALIARAAPALTRKAVRDLARRLRASHRELARKAGDAP